MSKVLGSWSGMRKYLEDEMLADSLSGRIQYSCTSYPNMDDRKIFEIRVDGKTQKQFSWETVAFRNCHGKGNIDTNKVWANFWKEKDTVPVENKSEFDDEEFCDALTKYRSMPFSESIESVNPIVRMFAILDRRVGKRTLDKLKLSVAKQPKWLQDLYLLRFSAENI